jgi:hypothetical protein
VFGRGREYWLGDRKERYRFQDLGVDGKKLKFIIKIGRESTSWVHVVQDKTSGWFCEKAPNLRVS